MEKIYISGTGRCGTTFLIKIFSFLDFDTGFTRDTYEKNICKKCNAGMEYTYNSKDYIIKNPYILNNIDIILKDENIKIKTIIIPIRKYIDAANSRVKNGLKKRGGLWNATDLESQITFYNKLIANYIYYMTKYNINTIFLDFDQMINDKEYLFNKLKKILDEKNITFELFSSVYNEVTLTSKPK